MLATRDVLFVNAPFLVVAVDVYFYDLHVDLVNNLFKNLLFGGVGSVFEKLQQIIKSCYSLKTLIRNQFNFNSV